MGRRPDDAQFNLRLGRPLLKQLQTAAKTNRRSLNSEMLLRLEITLRPAVQKMLDTYLDVANLKRMAETWERLAANTSNKAQAEKLIKRAELARELLAEQEQELTPIQSQGEW
jgi:hypothetical protein